MAAILYIADPVVTEDLLSREHQGQEELCVQPQAVITPTGWDYIRRQRLRLSRGEVAVSNGTTGEAPAAAQRTGIEQVRPASIEGTQLVQEGRCDFPDRSCGCQTEEFGSGFMEPSSCGDCAIHQLAQEGQPNVGCQGCNRYKLIQDLVAQGRVADMESLVQQITDEIVDRFEA
jgi:hypothetical protein